MLQAAQYTLGQAWDYKGYHIPDYQRNYIWSDEKADDLWTDLMDVYMNDPSAENTPYVLGALVVLEQNKKLEIVDGQQRLVTLTLMFCAIRDVLKKNPNTDKTLLESVVKEIDKSKSEYEYIRLHDAKDNNMLQKIIKGNFKKENPSSTSQRAMLKNYELFFRRSNELCEKCIRKNESTKGLLQIRHIIDDLKKKILFVRINVIDEEQAYQVFQTLNSKGEELNQADLIKSDFIKKANNNQCIYERWKIFHDIKKPDNLIYESVLSRSTKTMDAKKRDLYKNTIKECKTQKQIDTYLDNLEEDLKIIGYLNDPESLTRNTKKNRNDLVHLLYGLTHIQAKYFRRPIITAFRVWGIDDPKTFDLIDCFVKFFFMYHIIGGSGIDLLRQIAKNVTKQIIEKQSIEEIFWTILKDDTAQEKNYVSKEDFKKNFKEYEYKKTAIAHYVLASLEFHLQVRGSQTQKHLYELEVEHIFPQKPDKTDWPNLDELRLHLNRLGNLALITRDWNKSLRNAGFKKKLGSADENGSKIKSYMNSGLQINTKYLKGYDKWTQSEITDRENKLNELVPQIWDLTKYAVRAKKQQPIMSTQLNKTK